MLERSVRTRHGASHAFQHSKNVFKVSAGVGGSRQDKEKGDGDGPVMAIE